MGHNTVIQADKEDDVGIAGEPQEGLLENIMRRVSVLEAKAYVIGPFRREEPSAHDLVQELDIALHGQTTALTESPKEKWEALLREVRLLVARTPLSYADAVRASRDIASEDAG